MYIFDFHSHENSSKNYNWNAYEEKKQLSLSKEVEKH